MLSKNQSRFAKDAHMFIKARLKIESARQTHLQSHACLSLSSHNTAENALIFNDLEYSFRVTFLNKCDEAERPIIAEYYQRCFAIDLPSDWVSAINESSNTTNE